MIFITIFHLFYCIKSRVLWNRSDFGNKERVFMQVLCSYQNKLNPEVIYRSFFHKFIHKSPYTFDWRLCPIAHILKMGASQTSNCGRDLAMVDKSLRKGGPVRTFARSGTRWNRHTITHTIRHTMEHNFRKFCFCQRNGSHIFISRKVLGFLLEKCKLS